MRFNLIVCFTSFFCFPHLPLIQNSFFFVLFSILAFSLYSLISLGPIFSFNEMANYLHNNTPRLLGTHLKVLQRPPHKGAPVGPDTSGTSDLQLIKTYFKLLQAIHHIEILDEALMKGAPPTGMAKKVAHLTAFIKPAAPDSIVKDKIKNNTMDWMNNNLKILKEHYVRIQKDLSNDLGPFNGEALDRALRWARQRYGRRLTLSSISTLRLLLNTSSSLPPPTPLLISNTIAFPPLPTQPQVTPAPFRHRNTLTLPSRPLTIPSLLSLPPLSFNLTQRFPPSSTVISTPQPPRPTRPPIPRCFSAIRSHPLPTIPLVTTLAVTDPPQPTVTSETIPKSPTSDPPPSSPLEVTDPPQLTVIPKTIPKPPTSDPPPSSPLVVTDPPQLTVIPKTIPKPPTSDPPPSSPLAVTDPPQLTVTSETIPEPSTSYPPPSSLLKEGTVLKIKKPDNLREVEKKPTNLFTFKAEIHSSPPSPPPVTLSSHQIPSSLLPPSPSSPSPSSLPLLFLSSDNQPRTPFHYQPRIHPHTNRKATMWALPIRKPMIIMGDSNVARIPKFQREGIQADSFPGATLRHLTAILLRLTSPRPDVKLILFSIGINNCLREQTALTIIKDTRRLIRVARTKFPQARIAIPLLTVSIRLSAKQLLCVKAFNTFLRDNMEDLDSRCGYLNQLSLLKFQTIHDNIHWTPETAGSMLQDWLTQLGL